MKNKRLKVKKNEYMNKIEKCNFLQNEFEYNRERKDDLLGRADGLFAWNAALFGFVFIFFKFEKFINYISYCLKNGVCTVKTIILLIFLFVMISGIVLCCISFGLLFMSFKTKQLYSFSDEELEGKKFAYDAIIDDYIKINNDFDSICVNIAEKIDKAFLFMFIGFILTMIPMMLITILLYI